MVEPIGLEETLPDGHVFAPTAEGAALGVRLYIQVESRAGVPFAVAFCNGGLAVVPLGSRRPFCAPFGVGDWTLLRPGGSVSMYPTVGLRTSNTGRITETLLPHTGHAPAMDWPQYRPNPVSFELTSTGCVPTGDTD